MNGSNDVALALLEIHAVGFKFDEPIRFVSGILSPVYVDNRKLPYFPKQWQIVLSGLKSILDQLSPQPEVIAGIETAGIPHSATLGYMMQKPSIFIRKKAKDHGTRSKIEGGEVVGKRVVLIEDMVTTGGSSMKGVESLQEAGALVTDCVVITSYNFPESVQVFSQANVRLHVLCPFEIILDKAIELKYITSQQKEIVEKWKSKPREWTGDDL